MSLPSVKAAEKKLEGYAKTVELTGFYGVELAASLAEYALLLISFFYAWLLVLGVGITLVVMRQGFLDLIPWFRDHIKFATAWVNWMLIVLQSLEDVLTAVVNFILGALALFGYHGKTLKYHKFYTLTERQVQHELNIIAINCAHIDSTYKIAEQFTPELIASVGGDVCPYFRLIQPLPHNVGDSIYAPFSSYVPDPSPWPMGNNCASNSTNQVNYGVLCGSIAVGYPVLEILLPMVLIGIFLLSSGSAFAHLIGESVILAEKTFKFAVSLAEKIVRATSRLGHIICKSRKQ